MATQTIKEVTKGNEFKSNTHTVTLPNGTRITRTVDRQYGRSSFSSLETGKICAAFGYNSSANLLARLRKEEIDVESYGSGIRFAKNHVNKMLRVLWTSGGAVMYVPKKGFEQAIRTILNVTKLKAEYTPAEVSTFEKNGILDQMFNKVTKKALTLPEINGYKGTVTGSNIVYGCASLPLAWFTTPNGGTRTIESLVLSSGVKISKAQMDAIEAYLKENKISK